MSGYDINGQAVDFMAFNRAALAPKASVVVRACAGSGKTWLLTSRIIRLLLDGVAPHQILAITFTKKAAQEMRDRVMSILATLADAPDEQVKAELSARGLNDEQVMETLPRARVLYHDVVGAGQQIAIDTFHAWFYRLLQAAPVGSGVKRNATLSEDMSELRERAWDVFYEQFNHADGAALRDDFLYLIRELTESATLNLLEQALKNTTEIHLFTQSCAAQGVDVMTALAQDVLHDTGLEVSLGESAAYARWAESINHNHQLDVLIQALSCGNADKQARGDALLRVLNHSEPLAQWQAMMQFTVADGSRLNGNAFKTDAKQRDAMAGSVSIEQYEAAKAGVDAVCAQLQNDLADCAIFALNARIMPCVQALLAAYRQVKDKAKQLDFADIEWMCYSLLQNEATAAYIQVQLDARYKHLLFDEFQDTNPLQWQIINSWLAAYDFDAMRPYVFLVGDVKQSIYRFRKADARVFDEAEHLLVHEYGAKVLRTHATRRNSKAVVSWVNAMFAQPECALADFSPHHTFNQDVGHVAVLGLEGVPDDAVEVDNPPTRDWLRVPQHAVQSNTRDDESQLIIDSITQLVGHYPVKDEVTHQSRPARYSDIMLLVYNRTHLSGYERLLRQARIPFVSSKRGGLLATLEALDVMALLRCLMDAHDDIALLHVLRTPIFDVSDDDLQMLNQHRAAQSYWHALNLIEHLSDALQHAKKLLNAWIDVAHHLPPHDVLDMIYAQGEVFKNYAARTPAWLNAQVQANLREFLQLALSVNAGRYPSMSALLQALERWQKQEQDGLMEAAPLGMTDAVQILSVHGSKGLEAPIVMLIDMKKKPNKNQNLNAWLIDWQPNEALPNHISWVGQKQITGAWRSAKFAANNQLAALEQLNLCYVAMTRARQVLLVSAAQLQWGDEEEQADGLYGALHAAMRSVSENHHLSAWSSPAHEPVAQSPHASTENTWSDIELIPHDSTKLNRAKSHNPTAALGVAWHGVLEYATEHSGQMMSLADVVARFGVSYSQADEAVKLAQILLDKSPWLDATQWDEACNEMAVVTSAGQIRRIDRWVRKGNAITVIDYKLSWDDDTLPQYRAQVSEYVALMQRVYPDAQVSGVLLSPKTQLQVV